MSMERLMALDTAPPEALQSELVEPPAPEIGTAANIAVGAVIPPIDKTIHAMIIMSGCIVRFVGYYWMVEHRKTGNRTNVSLSNNYEEWRAALNKLGEIQYAGDDAHVLRA